MLEQMKEYQNYLEILSSNASIAQTINFQSDYKVKIEIVINMLKKGFDIDLINEMTKIPKEIIEKYYNDLNYKEIM